MEMDTAAVLKNIVRIGRVSSVDIDSRTVRAVFADKQDGNGSPLVSGLLKVLQNQPLVTIEKWIEDENGENKWDFNAEYNSHNRELGLGESYVKKDYANMKDVIINEKTIKSGSLLGVRQTVTIYPWLPYIGQFVVCLFLPNGNSDGFVLGGI